MDEAERGAALAAPSSTCTPQFSDARLSAVVGVFQRALSGDGQLAVAVAAIKALTSVIENSKASTMMGLEIELSRAAETLRRGNPTSISLSAGCELFMRCASAWGLAPRLASLTALWRILLADTPREQPRWTRRTFYLPRLG